jgi:hypothetical protein
MIITGDQPLFAHFEHGDDIIVLQLERYDWYRLGSTRIVHAPERLTIHTRQFATFADAAQRLFDRLYGGRMPFQNTFRVYVRPCEPLPRNLVGTQQSRTACHDECGKPLCMYNSPKLASFRVTAATDPTDRSGEALTIGELMPLVPDGMAPADIDSMLNHKLLQVRATCPSPTERTCLAPLAARLHRAPTTSGRPGSSEGTRRWRASCGGSVVPSTATEPTTLAAQTPVPRRPPPARPRY